MADLATLKDQLATLEQREFELLSGDRISEISDETGSVKYGNFVSDIKQVRSMIFKIKSQIRSLEGCGGPIRPMATTR